MTIRDEVLSHLIRTEWKRVLDLIDMITETRRKTMRRPIRAWLSKRLFGDDDMAYEPNIGSLCIELERLEVAGFIESRYRDDPPKIIAGRERRTKEYRLL